MSVIYVVSSTPRVMRGETRLQALVIEDESVKLDCKICVVRMMAYT